jgi:hypothetical protein
MTTERMHRTIFYYENNEYLMKYAGTISIFPNGAVAPDHSKCLSALFSSTAMCTLTVRPSHLNPFWFVSPHLIPHTIRVLPYSNVWGGTISNLFSPCAWLARPCEQVHILKEYLKCLLAVVYNYGIHMTITQLQ